jgi:hypothetical protein
MKEFNEIKLRIINRKSVSMIITAILFPTLFFGYPIWLMINQFLSGVTLEYIIDFGSLYVSIIVCLILLFQRIYIVKSIDKKYSLKPTLQNQSLLNLNKEIEKIGLIISKLESKGISEKKYQKLTMYLLDLKRLKSLVMIRLEIA